MPFYLFMLYVFYYLLIFHLVDLGEFLIWKVDLFPPHKKCGHPCSRPVVPNLGGEFTAGAREQIYFEVGLGDKR